jgi:hypothetical protein
LIADYRRAVEAAAAGKLQESFDRLDRMGAVVPSRLDRQQQMLADQYLEHAANGQTSVVVSQTWSEVHRVNQQVRTSLKQQGYLGQEDSTVKALEKIDLTAAQKRDPRFYEPETIVVFNQKLRNAEPGTIGRFYACLDNQVVIDTGGRMVSVPHRYLDRISICRQTDVQIAAGERLQLKANRKLPAGSSVTNGELVSVKRVRTDGTIELVDGRVLDANYREFVPGYAVTSYGSQGKTVDYVLFSDSTVKAATNDQQWYVTISRGRKGIRIFTPDKELRENVLRSGKRKLALEIAKKTATVFTPRHHQNTWLRRFGRRVAGLIQNARRPRLFNRNRKVKNERQTTRMLVH